MMQAIAPFLLIGSALSLRLRGGVYLPISVDHCLESGLVVWLRATLTVSDLGTSFVRWARVLATPHEVQ